MDEPTENQEEAMPEETSEETLPRMALTRDTKIVLAAFLFSGAAALIYEVTWTRALSLVLGSTVYALSTMLSTFMGGLALGSYIGGKISDARGNHLLQFGICELGIGITGLISIPLIYSLPKVYLNIYSSFHEYPKVFFTLQVMMCISVMIIPTTLMGATFPLVSKQITKKLDELGRKVGDAYSFNTIGAVLGSLSVGFLLIPSIGVKGATFFAAGMNLTVGLLLVITSRTNIKRVTATAVALFILAGAWNASAEKETMFLNFYSLYRAYKLPYHALVEGEKQRYEELYYEEHQEGTVRALRDRDGSLVLQVGGKIEGTGMLDIPNTLLLAYLPIASHPSPKNFLTIGLGAGVTLRAAKSHLDDVDLVEINPAVVRAIRQHGHAGLLDNIDIIISDARNYLMRTDKRYDIISSEPSYPTETSVANLFTREFYTLASSKLTDNGVYCQWLPYYILSNDDITMMIKTFGSVFPHVYLWKVESSLDLLLVGSKKPFEFSTDEIRKRVFGLTKETDHVEFVLSREPDQIAQIVSADDGIPLNTDDRPLLEFHTVRNILTYDFDLIEMK